ncbi:hypothetical protein UFOVP245_58 [uncultured Caudovirales phage]|uniref:Uncharacterized protein n=1 Tax=uncultured Caudovirales phage TaxID=2100421 RepID=A0A6J7WY76_9CAUD|nr:hypothetical protein UFOVP245_58 [uncultured Caudovirales phage]
MKKIERPIATSYVDEAIFHYCKSDEEVRNAFANVNPEDIYVYKRWVDMETFQPWLMVLVKNGSNTISEWYKWIVPLQLVSASDTLKQVDYVRKD